MKKISFYFEDIFLGTDLAETARFANLKKTSRLARNIFTLRELEFCFRRADKAQALAARFAAKEAARKSIKDNLKFNKIEVINVPDGAPAIRYLDEKINRKYKTIVSLSHTKDYAQAVCLTLKNF